MQGNGFDMASYAHMDVDRFGVLLDLWTNETAYLENKRKVLTLLLFIPDEKILPFKFESIICFISHTVQNGINFSTEIANVGICLQN